MRQQDLMLPPIRHDLGLGPDATTEERFVAFHRANPHVYRKIVAIARELKGRGKIREVSLGYLDGVWCQRAFAELDRSCFVIAASASGRDHEDD